MPPKMNEQMANAALGRHAHQPREPYFFMQLPPGMSQGWTNTAAPSRFGGLEDGEERKGQTVAGR